MRRIITSMLLILSLLFCFSLYKLSLLVGDTISFIVQRNHSCWSSVQIKVVKRYGVGKTWSLICVEEYVNILTLLLSPALSEQKLYHGYAKKTKPTWWYQKLITLLTWRHLFVSSCLTNGTLKVPLVMYGFPLSV